jgi:branched-chain amino acid transport system ATP-binding protein
MPLLQLDRVNAGYGPVQVLRGVSLAVERGGVTALLGANGAGKTTTLRAISGVIKATSGTVTLDGRDITGIAPSAVARGGVGHVPDGRGTIAELTVEENLRVGGWLVPDAQLPERLDVVFSYFPVLKERRRQQAGTLSGGEQQMLAIGRALMPRPRLLLLDEPSFGVAPLIVERIFTILGDIVRSSGIAVLLIEQNARLALDFAQQAYVLESGRISLAGAASELKEHDMVRRSYLGT